MLRPAEMEMSTLRSSYGNKTSLQALLNFHQVPKLHHLNVTFSLFSASVHCIYKQVTELAVIPVYLVTIQLLDLDSLFMVLRGATSTGQMQLLIEFWFKSQL